ncbi:unnamed protein product [Adineta steineri]|uniref:Protein kinase domain-containing protein n=1 Tax=Adineta steineri TaxID=433720 RepID=A0A815LB47_9BILA|nr:unnamed protein product [Adineta steineri]CAF1407590.1 unnamed protein product [Adineta steineri]
MGTKISKQHHHHHQTRRHNRIALARDNILRIASQEIQNFNEIFSSTTVEIPFEEEKSDNNLATKKHHHDPIIQKEALGIRKSRSTGNLSSTTPVFTDQKKRTHRNKSSSSQNASTVHSELTTSFNQLSSSKLKRKKILHNSKLAFIDSKDLKYVGEIGKGNFGTVHHALYKGTHDVALKTLSTQDENPNKCSIYGNADNMNVILQEATIMTRLRHANLLRIIGLTFSEESQQLSLVTDFMRNGSLLDYLKRHRDIFLKSNSCSISKKLNYFARQIYEAMLYLEERHIIHRDLAARNCLIDDDDTLKVADFGLTKLTECGSYKGTHRTICAPRWTAPEALFSSEYSSRSDVWSYGITLWEIYSLGDRPFRNMTNYALKTVLKNPLEKLSQYLPKPRRLGSDEIYTHIILPCLTNSVTMRPRFRDLKQRILDILVNEI